MKLLFAISGRAAASQGCEFPVGQACPILGLVLAEDELEARIAFLDACSKNYWIDATVRNVGVAREGAFAANPNVNQAVAWAKIRGAALVAFPEPH